MKRRAFILKSSLALSSVTMTSKLVACSESPKGDSILPGKLSEGDTVGLITPGSPLNDEAYQKVFTNLQLLKLNAKTSPNFNHKNGFIAGADKERLSDLHGMFADNSIKAIICGRGGYGTGRLLEHIDYDLIKENPKILIGFSDITALLNAIYLKTGMVCFHGPVAASEFTTFTKDSFQKVLMTKSKNIQYQNQGLFDSEDPSVIPFTINEGKAQGKLIGGNLSILTSLLGTPYFPDLEDKILFLEEIGEYPYRVDRMITQLLNTGQLQKVAGIALGIFYKCKDTGEDQTKRVLEVIQERLSRLQVPVIYGLPIGHVDHNATLPIGINAQLDSSTKSLTILESAVI